MTPLQEGGIVMGYLSVRRKAQQSEVQQAEQAYRAMCNGNPQRLAVRQGQLLRGVGDMLARLMSSSLRLRVAGALAAIALLFAAIGIGAIAYLEGPLRTLFAGAGLCGVLAIVLLDLMMLE